VTALPLTAEDEDLVAAYAADLSAAGLQVDHAWLWGGRAFLHRYGGGEGWNSAPLAEQLGCNVKIHRFVLWLIATGRMTTTADYLLARRNRLGEVLARHIPGFHERFVATARELGFVSASITRQWKALAWVCALHGLQPHELTHTDLDAARAEFDAAADRLGRTVCKELRSGMFGLEATLFHAGITDQLPRKQFSDRSSQRAAQWAPIPTTMASTMHGYLEQIALSLRPGTVANAEATLREFATFVIDHDPALACVAEVTRSHIEAYKLWLSKRPGRLGAPLHRHTIRDRLIKLRVFFERIIEWDHPDAPARMPIFAGDLPIKDEPLPRFLDDGAAAKLLAAARSHPDPLVRLLVEFLARTGMRKGELLGLTVDAVVQIGSAFWLRIPVGKLHNDRYIPLHPQLKDLLDDWLDRRATGLRSELLFIEHGRRISQTRVDRAVADCARRAGIGHATPHQLRHTLATQAVNRGMSLEAIAALLGHKSLRMTAVYARIADRTVADEYFAVTEKVEALYDLPKALPAEDEGSEMAKLRREMNRRLLGNGWCTRPVELDCHFETICESCTCFITTLEFRPTLQAQRDDATAKGQVGRQKIFDGLLARLDQTAS
jgi:integrase